MKKNTVSKWKKIIATTLLTQLVFSNFGYLESGIQVAKATEVSSNESLVITDVPSPEVTTNEQVIQGNELPVTEVAPVTEVVTSNDETTEQTQESTPVQEPETSEEWLSTEEETTAAEPVTTTESPTTTEQSTKSTAIKKISTAKSSLILVPKPELYLDLIVTTSTEQSTEASTTTEVTTVPTTETPPTTQQSTEASTTTEVTTVPTTETPTTTQQSTEASATTEVTTVPTTETPTSTEQSTEASATTEVTTVPTTETPTTTQQSTEASTTTEVTTVPTTEQSTETLVTTEKVELSLERSVIEFLVSTVEPEISISLVSDGVAMNALPISKPNLSLENIVLVKLTEEMQILPQSREIVDTILEVVQEVGIVDNLINKEENQQYNFNQENKDDNNDSSSNEVVNKSEISNNSQPSEKVQHTVTQDLADTKKLTSTVSMLFILVIVAGVVLSRM